MSAGPFVVVGGGLHGCAVAWELARRGADVTMVERGVPGAEASTAAAGILSPTVETWAHDADAALGQASLAHYAGWVAGVERASGLSAPVHLDGVLVVGPHAPEGAQPVDGPAVEAALAPGPAWRVAGEGWIDPMQLVPAVLAAGVAVGVRVLRSEVLGVDASGVRLASGVLRGTPIVCAGAWTGQVPGLPALPVRPVRGQVLALQPPPGVTVRHVVYGGGGYLVPRADGRVLVGSTMEEVGFARGVTEAGVATLRARAERLCPALADATLLGAWSGFRPGTPDGLPLLGRVGALWVASGHHRNGILLAPYTAIHIADAILDGVPLPDSVRPDRFDA